MKLSWLFTHQDKHSSSTNGPHMELNELFTHEDRESGGTSGVEILSDLRRALSRPA